MALKYRFDGSTYTREKLSALRSFTRLKEPVLALGPGLPDRNVAYAFKNMAALYAAAPRMKLGPVFEKLKKGVAEARKASKGDLRALKARQIALAQRIKKDYEDLAARTGLPLDSEQLFLRATTKAPVLEGPVFDPACVYTGAGFTGSFMCVGVPLANLTWFPGFNNTITSVRAAGVCVLYSGTWFRGSALVLVGLPLIALTNLALVTPTVGALANFNNVTSSVYAYLY